MASPAPTEVSRPAGSRGSGAEAPQGRLLRSVFTLLETSGTPYCILHGYEEYPASVSSDVDCIMPAEFLPRRFATLLRENRDLLGATVVQWLQHESTAHYFVLATEGVTGRWEFLAVDASSDFRGDGRIFYGGEELMASRRLDRGFWVPSPALEFGSYLVKKIQKGTLGTEHDRRLTELYRQDPTGCDREIGRFWQGESVRRLRSAAPSGEWQVVRDVLPALQQELLSPDTGRKWRSATRYWAADAVRRVRRWSRPTGTHVVLLGADGSGKSTIISALGDALAPAFRRVTTSHLAPALFRRARPTGAVTAPHSRPPRSSIGSLAKAAVWLLDYSLGYAARIRPALARSTLVLFDRYFIDTLVDPRRYRYGGPPWLLRAIWWLCPKPDLLILLDAPTETLRSRKQEVSRAETDRQRWAYRRLVEALPSGHIVDAAQPIERVAAAASAIVLDYLAARTSRRLAERHRAGKPV